MDLNVLITEINDLADEQEAPSMVVGFINDALAKINVEVDANFPFVTVVDASFTAFPEKWVRTLIIPFCVGRIKQRDSSDFEFSNAYNEFINNVMEFRMKYTIPAEYLDSSSSGVTEGDLLTVQPWNYGGW